MSLTELVNRDATLIKRHPGGTDIYGDSVPVESEEAVKINLQQRKREEEADQPLGREVWDAIFLPGTDLAGVDAIEIEGAGVFEIEGNPENVWNEWRQTFTQVEATLVRVGDLERVS